MQAQTPQQNPGYDDSYESSDNHQSYDDKDQEFISAIIDVSKTLKHFEMTVLRGRYESEDTKTGEKKWVKFDPNAKSIINEIGVREILGRLSGYVNKETVMTYFEEEEIYKNLFYADMSITELFAKRADYWELDCEVAKSIKDSCIELIQSILFRARRGFTAINLRSTYSKSEVSRTDQQNKPTKTFLGIPIGK
jgi:hypothetical protein